MSSYVCCSSSTLMIDLVGITRWGQQKSSAPSAHECLPPLEVCILLIDEGEKEPWFRHYCEGRLQCLFRVLVGGGEVSTWAPISLFVICSPPRDRRR